MNLGENIKKARKAAHVTQKELAERLQVHQQEISFWEKNKRMPSVTTLARICTELKISADTLLEINQEDDLFECDEH